MAASLNKSPRLESLTDSELTKSTYFSLMEEVIQKNVIMKHEQLYSFVELLNKNLSRQDNTVRILKIFMNILAKYEAGVYTEFPLFEATVDCVLTVLKKVLKSKNWDDDNVKEVNYNALKLLLDIPSNVFQTVNVQVSNSILELVESYLTTSSNELPSHNKVFLLLRKLLKSFGEDERIAFIKNGMHVWFAPLMSFIFKKENAYRDFGVIIAEEIMPFLSNMDYYDNPHWQSLYKNFLDSKKYPDVLVTLLKNEDSYWHRLWIIIIKLSGTELHKSGGSINPLLFVIQEGFKKSIDIKCQSFKCLRVLIDNFALNTKVLHNTSRIKVLSIALESNNAKTEKVGVLKFEIWWHLITLLQPKIRTNASMILLPFLRYCFSDPMKNLDPKRSRTYPGEMFPKVQQLAIKTFVEICGHSECPGCIGDDLADLPGSILDSELLEQSYAIWIYSLKQVTIYTRLHLSNSNRSEFEMLIKNLKCIWRSFIKAASKINNPEHFTTVFEHLFKLLSLFVEEYASDPLFAEIILMLIIPAFVDKDVGYSTTVLKNDAIKIANGENPINSLIDIILLPKMYHVETMLGMNFDFKNVINVGLSGNVKEFSDWLLNKLTPNNHCPILWYHLANGLANTNQITTAALLPALLWPINNYKGDVKLSDIIVAWKNLLNISKSKIRTTKNKPLPEFESDILTGLENCDNDLLALSLLPEFIKKQSADRPADIVFFNRHLTIFTKYLNKIDTQNIENLQGVALCDSLHIFASLLDTCHTYSIKSPEIDSLLSTLNINLKGLLFFFNNKFQDYIKARSDCAKFINSVLETMTKLHLSQYSAKLMTNINGLLWILMKNVDNIDVDAKFAQLLANQKSLDKSELVKIQQLLKSNKKSKKKVADASKTDFETPSSVTKSAKKGKSKSNDKDEFVVIKPTWKFDPKKLTEHQKDVLNRRRDDIPALYEDLSQSQDDGTMNSWRPPGYKSDSHGDSSLSQDITVNTFINKLAPKKNDSSAKKIVEKSENEQDAKAKKSESKPKLASPFATLKKITVTPATPKIDESSTPNNKKPMKKLIITPKTDKNNSVSILSSDLNEDDEVKKSGNRVLNSAMKESNIIGTPSTKDRLELTPKNSPDVHKMNLENCEFAGSPITNSAKKKKSLFARLNDSIKSLKGETNDENSPQEDIIPIVMNDDKQDAVKVDVQSEKLDDTTINATDNNVLTPTRPIRVRRKPNKFLADESSSPLSRKDLKSSENSDTADDKSSQGSNNSDDGAASVRKKARKSRLLNQLEIDTNEGHPLINISNSGSTPTTRNTRRSLCKAIESNDSQSSDKSIDSKDDATPKEDAKAKEDDKPKSIHSMDTECYTITEEVKDVSIFSQETENCIDEPSESPKEVEDQIIASDTSSLAPLDVDKCNQSESFDCSPDFIGSSQEDVESITSLTLVVSKSKDISSGSEDNLNKIEPEIKTELDDVALDVTDLNTQQISEADTEPMDVETANTEASDIKNNTEELIAEANTEPMDLEADAENNTELIDLEADTEANTEAIDADANGEVKQDVIPMDEPVLASSLLNDVDEIQSVSDEDNASNSVANVSIVSSPRKDDVEERNMELMNKTIDLSPIKGVSFYENSPVREEVSPEKADANVANTPKDTTDGAVAKNPSPAVSPDLFCHEKVSPFKGIEKINEISPPKILTSSSAKTTLPKNIWKFPTNNRAAQLIEMCMIDNEEYQQEKKDYEENKKDTSPVKLNNKVIPMNDDEAGVQPLLEFNKVIPCFTASPVGPILKRKFEADGPTLSPSSKRKRVSFHDPPVSTMMSVEKYIVPRTPKSPQSSTKSMLNIRTDLGSPKPTRMMLAKKCLMNKIKNIEKLTDTDSQKLSDIDIEIKSKSIDNATDVDPEKLIDPILEPDLDENIAEGISPLDDGNPADTVHAVDAVTDSQLSDICSLSVDSPQPLEIVTNHMLDDKNPIYPTLIDCRVSINEISSDLSSPLWNSDFLSVITETISTIGDLAKLTELEINRLPFKSPKIETVKKALENYEERMRKYNFSAIKITDSFFEVTFNTTNVEKIQEEKKRENLEIENVAAANTSVNDEEMDVQEQQEEKVDESEDTTMEASDTDILTSPRKEFVPEEIVLEEHMSIVEAETKYDDIKILNSLLESRGADVLKTVTEKLPHSEILDSVPMSSLMQYISDKISSDADFSNEIKSKFDDVNKRESLKSFRDELNSGFKNILSNFDKLFES